MRNILLLAFASLFSFQIFAQMPAGGPGGKSFQTPPSIGHVYGKLVDSLGKGVGEASVVITQNRFDSVSKKKKDVLLKAIITKSNGEFSFSELPVFGALKLKISAVGFKAAEQSVSFQPAPGAEKSSQNNPMGNMMNAFDKDLGNIKLSTEMKVLEGVTVTTTASALKLDIDKKVFNVEKNIVSAGGTAVDVMRNVPSVQVDIDGNVKLRNAAPQIYVDGRPTTLSLDQIPADAIQSVEVITNPSAKYDASGGNAGILNVVLKKNRQTGYNGNIMAGVDKRGGVNGGGNFNIRQGKINLSAAMMVNQMKNRTTGTTDRSNLGDTIVNVSQQNANKTNGGFMFGKLGLDYFITNRTTLSIGGVRVHGEFKPNEVIDVTTDSLLNGGNVSNMNQRLTTGKRTFNAAGLQLGMKHIFPKAGEEWTADLNYFSGKNSSSNMNTTNYYNKAGSIDGTQFQQVLGSGTNKFLTVQSDYVKPFTGTTKLEAGVRAQLRNTVNNNDTYLKGIESTEFLKIGSATNNYKNHDNVYAAYVSVTSAIKDFGYQIGLRAESSDYKGELVNTGETFSNKYPVSLFPSVFLSQKIANKQELQMSYTRRVNRPNFFQIIPYTDYTDSLNITRGNPALVPEFTNSLEFSYGKTFKGNNNLLASVYYKHSTNLITRYLSNSINAVTGKEDIINTYINANSSYSYGAELTSVNYLTKWWDITSNVNLYNSKINTDNVGTSQDALLSWFGKVNTNFKFPANFALQLSADYQSKTNLPISNGGQNFGPPSQAQSSSQGYIKPFWGMDAALRKSFLKNNAASVSLSISDIFRTRKSDQYSTGPGFTQEYYRLNNPQMIKLNFTYRFGKLDMSLFKRQNTKGQAAGMQGATDGM